MTAYRNLRQRYGRPAWLELTLGVLMIVGLILVLATRAAAVAITEPNESNFIAVESPAGGLNTYWNANGTTTWHAEFPLPSRSVYSQPALLDDKHGANLVAYVGANHTLNLRVNLYGSTTWAHEIVAPAGSAYSMPALNQGNNTTAIAVEGPDNSLDFYWASNTSDEWNEQVVAPSGTTYSAPVIGESNQGASPIGVSFGGWTDIVVVGQNKTLIDYKEAWGSNLWSVVYRSGNDTAFSVPSITESGCTGVSSNDDVGDCINWFGIAVEGPNHSLVNYYEFSDAPSSDGWSSQPVAGSNTTYSAPVMSEGNGSEHIAVEGPSHTLLFYWERLYGDGWNKQIVDSSARAYSVPSMADAYNATEIAVEGRSQSLLFYWQAYGAGWSSPQTVAGSGSSAGGSEDDG